MEIKDVFVEFGNYFGGLESISLDTLNMINVLKAINKSKKNLSGFILATIEFKDESRVNFYLNLGDIKVVEESSIVQNALFEDFSI